MRKLCLFYTLDLLDFLDKCFILCQILKAVQPFKAQGRILIQRFGYKFCKLRVAEAQPAARSDAVGDVDYAVGIDLVPLLKDAVFKNFGVNGGYSVDLVGHKHSKPCHMHGILIDNIVG